MEYISTRGKTDPVSASEAIKEGIAPDGGLFLPAKDVNIPVTETMVKMSYQELAAAIIAPYLTDYGPEELLEAANAAYSPEKFDDLAVTPLHKISPSLFSLELWHGPTCAFKDIALQLLPHLLTAAIKKSSEKKSVFILVATSGDTGKAALEGFRDIPGTRIAVFYPDEGVSEIQKRQMVTQEGSNVSVIAVKGNFDDAQSAVKQVFADKSVAAAIEEKGYRFSSANSINWGRLVPQIVYYYRAYIELLKSGAIADGEKINFVVPTGNFGNILAAFYARSAGLPINRLICAANSNNVLTDFIVTGSYNRNRPFIKTISPSMDILISSNLERLLFELTGHDAEAVASWMSELNENGSYTVDEVTGAKIRQLFWSASADDRATIAAIRRYYKEYSYLMDTHTAVAAEVYDRYLAESGDDTKTVIVSTANPYKFNESVAAAVLSPEETAGKDEFELLQLLESETGQKIPAGLKNLDKKKIIHDATIKKGEIRDAILQIIS